MRTRSRPQTSTPWLRWCSSEEGSRVWPTTSNLTAPGMHTTATIDYGVVLSGQAVLELDDGASITLNAGDTYIQNGTRHRWSNPGDVPAVIAVTFIGANHEKVG